MAINRSFAAKQLLFIVALLGNSIAAVVTAKACEPAPRALPLPIPFEVGTGAPVLSVSGDGITTAIPDEIDLELSVAPAPIAKRFRCDQPSSVAPSEASRSLTAAELSDAVAAVRGTLSPKAVVRSRMTYPPRSTPQSNERAPYQVGQIEIAYRSADEIKDALVSLRPLIRGNDWEAQPLRVVNLALRERSCDPVKRALLAAREDAERRARNEVADSGFSVVSAVDYKGNQRYATDSTTACANAFAPLSGFPAHGLIDIASGLSNRDIVIPRLRINFRGAGVFRLNAKAVAAMRPIRNALATTVFPVQTDQVFSASLQIPAGVSYVSTIQTYGIVVPKTATIGQIDDAVGPSAFAGAMQAAKARAAVMARAAHRRLGALVAINVARSAPLSTSGGRVLYEDDDAYEQGDRELVTRTIVAAWELLGPSSRTAGGSGEAAFDKAVDFESNAPLAIVPELAGAAVTGVAAQSIVPGSTASACERASMLALTTAVHAALRKTGGSVRAIADLGEVALGADTCVSNLAPFSLHNRWGGPFNMDAYLGLSDVASPALAERVAVVP